MTGRNLPLQRIPIRRGLDHVVVLYRAVPKDADTKEAYGNRPVASGPYKIENYELGTALSLVRNENWDPTTDPNRPAYPDRFQIELNTATARQ